MKICAATRPMFFIVCLPLLILLPSKATAQENNEGNNDENVNLFGGNNSAFGENPFNDGENNQDFNSIEREAPENGFGLEGNQELFLNDRQSPGANLYSDPLQSESYGPEEPATLPPETPGESAAATPPEVNDELTEAPADEPVDFFAAPESAPEPAPEVISPEPQDPLADPLAETPNLALDPFAAPFGSDPSVPAQPETDPLAGVAPGASALGPDQLIDPAPSALPLTPDEITMGEDPSAQQVPEDPLVNGIRLSELTKLRKAIAELKPKDPGTFPDEYIVQPGDTLWDISDQLLDDPFWWPKLWSYNPGIINPHLIAPGMKIVFEASNGVLPPGLSLADNGDFLPVAVRDEDLGIVKNPLVESWKELDGTIVNPDEIPVSDSFDIFGDLKVSASKYISIPGYLAGGAPQSFSEIAALNTHRWAASKGDIVYTEPSGGWAPGPGEKFLVVREQSPAKDSEGTDHTPGFWVYSGVVGVVGRERTGRLRMIVEESKEGVRPGDRIVPFQDLLRPVLTKVDREPRETPAVVAAIGNGEQTLASLLDVVHLVGRTSELREGDIVTIYTHPSGALFPDEELEFARSGFARIINVSGNTAMGVVIRIDREIALGSQTVAGLSFH